MTEGQNARDLLLELGIGQFNATMIIPYMFIAPATTDPKAPQIILLVEAIQKRLYARGATWVPLSGFLDQATARALEMVTGPNWERMTWATNVEAVLSARNLGRFSPADAVAAEPLAGPLDFLPDVPGGIVTYGIAAFLLWRHLKKGRR